MQQLDREKYLRPWRPWEPKAEIVIESGKVVEKALSAGRFPNQVLCLCGSPLRCFLGERVLLTTVEEQVVATVPEAARRRVGSRLAASLSRGVREPCPSLID
jgi:hypothetical protein